MSSRAPTPTPGRGTPPAGRLRRAVAAATLLWLIASLSSCGSIETADPSNPGASTPVPPSSVTPSPAPDTWEAAGDSFGVDKTDWPETVKAAGPMLDRLPKTFADEPGETFISPEATTEDSEEGASAGVSYGSEIALSIAEAYVTTDTVDGKPERMTATDLMAAYFGLVYSCAEGSYRGTATPLEDELGPAARKKQPKGPVWFSCRIEGAEGDEDYTGHVVGWVSGDTAWQVIAPDRDAVKSLVTHLYEAKG